MVLNKFMHPKNPYKKKQPCFKDLAVKYEAFRKHVTHDEAGKVHINFKDAAALKALSWALLKDDFNLDVDLPLDRLIPTIPLRLNYILWLTDIVGRENVRGIDIGCGASCVYALLGVRLNKWKFLVTEADDTNFEFAKKNVEKNDFADSIQVIKVECNERIIGHLEDGDNYDFTMCNPPFFGSNLEAYALTTSRSEDRAEPSSVSTASESEAITPGGEVQFVTSMIDESLSLRDRIRVFTAMLGKKSSVGVLKEELRRKGIKNVGSYEFCQGRTMRWGLGWSFDPDVRFPKSPFQASKTHEKGPMCHSIPKELTCCKYEIQPLGCWLVQILMELSLKFIVIMDCEAMWSASVTAYENTWSHQRRKRRAEKRMQDLPNKMSPDSCSGISKLDVNRNPSSSSSSDNVSVSELCSLKKAVSSVYVHTTPDPHENSATVTGESSASSAELSTACSDSKSAQSLTEESKRMSECTKGSEVGGTVQKRRKSQLPVLFNAWFTFKYDDNDDIILEMKWLKGTHKESMHQVMQLIKNRLKM